MLNSVVLPTGKNKFGGLSDMYNIDRPTLILHYSVKRDLHTIKM